jgi:hypothetical protein
MKKILLIISLILVGFVSNAQIVKPDTLQLSAKELFGESDDWNEFIHLAHSWEQRTTNTCPKRPRYRQKN